MYRLSTILWANWFSVDLFLIIFFSFNLANKLKLIKERLYASDLEAKVLVSRLSDDLLFKIIYPTVFVLTLSLMLLKNVSFGLKLTVKQYFSLKV